MIRIIQASQLKGNQNVSLSIKDVCGMADSESALEAKMAELEQLYL